ncbi:hypothetical protein, partial [uncultured Tateyamaria sp.]
RRKGEVIAALRRMPSSVVIDLFKGNRKLFGGPKTGWNNRITVMTQVLKELRQPKEFRVPALADLRRNT